MQHTSAAHLTTPPRGRATLLPDVVVRVWWCEAVRCSVGSGGTGHTHDAPIDGRLGLEPETPPRRPTNALLLSIDQPRLLAAALHTLHNEKASGP